MAELATKKRTNEEWLVALQGTESTVADALEDLRTILLRGLKHALNARADLNYDRMEALAEDAVQDALLTIRDKAHTFKGNSMFTTWAHKIAVHKALSELRRKRWQDSSLDDMLESGSKLSTFKSSAPGPEGQMVRSQTMSVVQNIIQNELTDRQKQAMVLLKLKGVPMQEVAERMGMQRNALYKLMHDARLKLKKRLAQEGLTPEDVLRQFE